MLCRVPSASSGASGTSCLGYALASHTLQRLSDRVGRSFLLQELEVRKNIEGPPGRRYLLSKCKNPRCLTIADEGASFRNVRDCERPQSHQEDAGCVRGHRIIREDDPAEITGTAVQRSVPFHCNDAICDDEALRANINETFLAAQIREQGGEGNES